MVRGISPYGPLAHGTTPITDEPKRPISVSLAAYHSFSAHFEFTLA